MPKKSKRRTPRANKSPPSNLSPEAIEHKAREDLASGRHREAIAGFKQLFKLEPRPAWRSALADAYAGRARELAAKDMLKEALALWENRASLGEGIAFDPEQAALLLRMGRVESVLDLVRQRDAITPAERDRMRPLLAAAYLSGEDAVAERLPADDPVVLHAASARAALTAYCTGDDAALREALAAIPFRSPYRDWVQILKALDRLSHGPQEAAALLARVGDESAFCHLRRAVQLASLPEAAFLDAIPGAGRATVRFACILRGWSQARIALWHELNQLGTEPRPETLLRLMYRHIDALGEDWVHRRGLRLLIAGSPANRKWLKAAGAPPLSVKESIQLKTMDAERGGNLWDLQEQWEHYARHLIGDRSGGARDPDNKLRIALALRRCDRLGDVLARAVPSAGPAGLDGLVVPQLEESLTWDPDDRDTYLRLIGYYQRGKRLKDVRRLLKYARDHWPEDMQVLGADLDAALKARAFKKAAGLARKMLALDSINSGVRERLVEAHLAHARKQVVKGRADLARKELAEAGEWARSAHARDQVDLCSGLIALIEDAGSGAPALRDLVGRLGGALAGHLALALAAEALKISLPKLFKKIGVDMAPVAGRDDLLATLAKLRTHLDGGARISGKLGSYLSKALAKAPWTDLSKSETEAACDTLRRCGLHKARLRAAGAALKRWKGEPLFELHAFEAKYPKGHGNCSDRDIDRLELALDRAREKGDTRTAMRIEEILARLDPFGFGPMSFAPRPPSRPESYAPDEESISRLFEAIGLDETLNLLELPPNMKRDLKKLAREQGDEAVIETLISFLGMFGDIDDFGIDLPDPPAGGPKPPKPTGGKPKRRSAEDEAQDDNLFDQLDLF